MQHSNSTSGMFLTNKSTKKNFAVQSSNGNCDSTDITKAESMNHFTNMQQHCFSSIYEMVYIPFKQTSEYENLKNG